MFLGIHHVAVIEYSSPPPESTRALRPFNRGYTHLCMETDNMEEDFKHLLKCGMTCGGRDFVEMNDVKTIYGYDPEGNIIELQQCSPQSPQRMALLERLRAAGA